MTYKTAPILFLIFIGLIFIQISCAEEKVKEKVKKKVKVKRYKTEQETIEEFSVGSYEFEVYKIIKTDNELGQVEIYYDTTLLNIDDFCDEYCDDYCQEYYDDNNDEYYRDEY